MRSLILIVLGIIYFSCVQERHLKTITFKLDMRDVENLGNVGIRGDFTSNPWNETVLLSDHNNDSIFEGTFSEKTAANQIQFKFVNQHMVYELQDSDNRIITFKYQPETLVYEAIFNDSNGKQSVIK
nr:hypothetical protein [uncultured Psychroserpens sp.]